MPGPQAHLKPSSLDIDPADPEADKRFAHWMRTFDNYSKDLDAQQSKLDLLINHVGHQAFAIIENATDYEAAKTLLKSAYQKEINTIYAQHQLSTRKQRPEENIDDYIRNLRLLAKNCQFQAVTASENHDLHVRNAFIAGLKAPYIRQRLLENKALTLDTAVSTARSLEDAQKNSDTYGASNQTCSAVEPSPTSNRGRPPDNPEPLVAASRPYTRQPQQNPRPLNPPGNNSSCYYCGYDLHPRSKCPARDATEEATMPKCVGETLTLTGESWLLPIVHLLTQDPLLQKDTRNPRTLSLNYLHPGPPVPPCGPYALCHLIPVLTTLSHSLWRASCLMIPRLSPLQTLPAVQVSYTLPARSV